MWSSIMHYTIVLSEFEYVQWHSAVYTGSILLLSEKGGENILVA